MFLWGSVDDDGDRSRREVIGAALREYRQAGVETETFSPACSAERRAGVVNAFA
jgi:hypothetical protein